MKESEIHLLDENGIPFEVPEGGSLGLLALGYIGLMLWRRKRQEVQLTKQNATTKHEEA